MRKLLKILFAVFGIWLNYCFVFIGLSQDYLSNKDLIRNTEETLIWKGEQK